MRVLGVVRLPDSILLELLVVFGELLLLTDRVDIEGRDGCVALFELLRELCLLPELLEEDREDDDLRLCLAAKTGSDKITAPSIISTNFRLNPGSFMIKSRTNYNR